MANRFQPGCGCCGCDERTLIWSALVPAGVDLFPVAATGVLYDRANDRWLVSQSFPSAWWTAEVTCCVFATDEKPYRNQWLLEWCEGSHDGDVVIALMLVDQGGKYTVTEDFIDDRHDHAVFDATIGEKTLTAIIGGQSKGPSAGPYFKITSRPSGFLVSGPSSSLPFEGTWDEALVPNVYRSTKSTAAFYFLPIAEPVAMFLRITARPIDPTTTPPNGRSGNFTINRSRIANEIDAQRLECANPKICTVSDPAFFTPRWKVDTTLPGALGETNTFGRGWTACQSSAGTRQITAGLDLPEFAFYTNSSPSFVPVWTKTATEGPIPVPVQVIAVVSVAATAEENEWEITVTVTILWWAPVELVGGARGYSPTGGIIYTNLPAGGFQTSQFINDLERVVVLKRTVSRWTGEPPLLSMTYAADLYSDNGSVYGNLEYAILNSDIEFIENQYVSDGYPANRSAFMLTNSVVEFDVSGILVDLVAANDGIDHPPA